MIYSDRRRRRRAVSLPGPATAPTAWWQMDSTSPADVTPSPNNLSTRSNTTASVTSGIRGSCLGINALSGQPAGAYYARYQAGTGNKFLWTAGQSLSLNFWLKWSMTSAMLWQVTIGKQTANGTGFVTSDPQMYITGKGGGLAPVLTFYAGGASKGANASVTSNPSIAANSWNMYTITASYSNPTTTVKGYRNGSLVGTGTFTGNMGTVGAGNTTLFQLLPNDVTNLIYTSLIGLWVGYALTSTDITNLYNAGAGLQYNGSIYY